MNTANMTEPMLLSTREAAKTLGLSERTLWAQTAPRGPLACVRVGSRVQYTREALRAFVESRTVSAEP